MRFVRRLALAAAGTAAALILSSLAVREDTSVGEALAGFGMALAGVVLAAAATWLVIRLVPARWRPLALAATVVPAVTAAGALGLPETAIHFSDDAEWAYRAGREISFGALVVGAGLSGWVAWAHRSRLVVVAAMAVLTFGLATVARDLDVRQSAPSWCYADQVDASGGVVSVSGGDDGCTVLLPTDEP